MYSLETRFFTTSPLRRWSVHRILLAVSGGADSTALMRLFCRFREEMGLKLYVAHANHQLRGEESEGDAVFVKELCTQLGVPCVTRNLEIIRTSDGIEADARHARYDFLETTAEELGCRYIALAHHRDDQTETILHRILRGTGIAGLAGMAKKRPLNPAVTLIRPLLDFSRAEILEYLKELNQPFRTDSSNFCTDLTRNRLRQSLLPQLRQEFNPHLDEALVRLGTLASTVQAFVDAQILQFTQTCIHPNTNGMEILLNTSETQRFTAALSEEAALFFWTEVFRRIWREQKFPQQEMGLKEWTLLAEMACDFTHKTEKTHTFPGNILVKRISTPNHSVLQIVPEPLQFSAQAHSNSDL